MGRMVATRERVLLAQQLRAKGLSLQEIAEQLGVSISTVSRWLRLNPDELPSEEELRRREVSEAAGGEAGEAAGAGEDAAGDAGFVSARLRGEGLEPREESDVGAVDEKYMLVFRRLKSLPRNPLVKKELETQAWWHRLVHDVGEITVLIALSTMDVPLERLDELVAEWKDDPGKLMEYILDWLARSVEVRRDAAQLMRLRDDLRVCMARLALLARAYNRLRDAYNTVVSVLPDRLRLRVLTLLAAKQLMGMHGAQSPGMVVGGGNGERLQA